MGFYDRLERVSDYIDCMYSDLIDVYERLGLVGAILILIPIERAESLRLVLSKMEWSKYDCEVWLEDTRREEDHEICRMIAKVEYAAERLKYDDFKKLFNIYKYWWMPRKKFYGLEVK